MSKCKIAVIAHTSPNSRTKEAYEYADKIIEFIKNGEYTYNCGGCNGIIEYISENLSDKGGDVVYYSPSKNLEEHNKLYNLNIPNVKSVHFNTEEDLNYNFIYRSLEMIKNSDIVICFYGTWGTLGELDFAVMLGKTIIFIEESERNHMQEIYNRITELSEYDYNEKVYYAKNAQDLEKVLIKARNNFE